MAHFIIISTFFWFFLEQYPQPWLHATIHPGSYRNRLRARLPPWHITRGAGVRLGVYGFQISPGDSNLQLRLRSTASEGLNSSLGSQRRSFFLSENSGDKFSFRAAVLPNQFLLSIKTPGKAIRTLILDSFAGFLSYPPFFYYCSLEGHRLSPISIFND